METPALLLLTVFLLAIGIVVCTVVAIKIYDLAERWFGWSPIPLSSSVARAVRRVRILDAVLVVAAIMTMVAALIINAHFGNETVTRIVSDSMREHIDFETLWYSAKALWEGTNIYDTGDAFVSANAPLLSLLISPLTLLEPLPAYRLFVLIMLLMTVGYLAWVTDELRLRAAWAVVGAGMLLFSMPMLSTLGLGQIYLVLALGLVAAWIAYRRGRTIVAGAALGLVVII